MAYKESLKLFGEVNDKMAWEVLSLPANANNIEALMHSEGGDLGAAFAIYDRVSQIPKSTCTATGICFSASTLVLQAFKTRQATKNCQFIVHEGRYEDEDFQKHYAPFMNIKLKALIAERMTRECLNHAFKTSIFDAETAKMLGLIDKVV